jgi:two-component system, NarL family, nitrate/nitrite response regulator NarL
MKAQLGEPGTLLALTNGSREIPGRFPAPREEIHVLVLSDDPALRSELMALLNDQPDRLIVSEAEEDLQAAVDAARPDVVVWDIGWDRTSALTQLEDLEDPRLPIVVVVPDDVDSADLMVGGVRGIVRRNAGSASLGAAVRAASAGLLVIDASLGAARSLLKDPDALVDPLTARELEVLQLLPEGLSNRTIAERLKISENTAKFHIASILGKLGAQNRTEAVTRAARAGLIIL